MAHKAFVARAPIETKMEVDENENLLPNVTAKGHRAPQPSLYCSKSNFSQTKAKHSSCFSTPVCWFQ